VQRVQGFDGEIRGKETTWKTWCRYEDNIEMDMKLFWRAWTGLISLRQGHVLGSCEGSDKPLGPKTAEL
jgi:hypothetical protein